MDSLRRILATIQKNLAGLTGTHKLLVACMVVIIVLGLSLVALLTGRPSMVELWPGASREDLQRAKTYLDSQSIPNEYSAGGQLMVANADAPRARSVLAGGSVLPNDKAMYFETLLAKQSFMNSASDNRRNFHIALQNELARMIGDLSGVDFGRVILDVPEAKGLGASVRTPKATVTVKSEDGRSLPQSVVDGVAHLVEGSVAGLALENVTIVDASTGAHRTVTTDANAALGVASEQAAKVEAQTRAKLQEMLAHIPGVVVTVTASVDVTRSTSQTQSYLPLNKGSVSADKRTSTTTNSTSEATGAAVPGVQANQTADITRAPGLTGSKTDSNEETVESETRFGSKTETVVDPRGNSLSVAVSVNVPKGYVAKLLQGASGPGETATPPATAPDEAAIRQKFETEVQPDIVNSLTPHLRTMIAQANAGAKPDDLKAILKDSINVAMVPGDVPAPVETQTAGLLGGLAGGGSSGMFSLGGGLIDKAVLVVLSLLAMGLMIMMVRKAGRKTEAPTAEELVGLPPALEAAGDVIGEADEGETALAGIEVGEQEMEAAKRLEQVEEMVGKDPAATAKMLGRWINVEE